LPRLTNEDEEVSTAKYAKYAKGDSDFGFVITTTLDFGLVFITTDYTDYTDYMDGI